MSDEEILDEEDDDIITCWCGAKGTYDELFDDATLEDGCGGTGLLYCFCGGDQCVCHNHGETECPGCDDCLEDDPEWDGPPCDTGCDWDDHDCGEREDEDCWF